MQSTQPFPSPRRCPDCGFELTGYGRLAPCPSCGRKPPERRGGALTTRYEDTPVPYLRRTFRSTTMLAVGAGISIGAFGLWLVLLTMHHVPLYGKHYVPWNALLQANAACHLIAALGSLVYLTGVWMVTSPEGSILPFTKPGACRSMLLRRVCLYTQSGWFFYHAAAFVAHFYPPGDSAPPMIAGVFFVIASLGLIPFTLHLSGLASWAFGDEFAGTLAVSGVGVGCAGVLLGIGYTFGVPEGALGVVLGLTLVVVHLLIPIGIYLYLRAYFRLANLTKWSIRCRHETDARRIRLRARAANAAAAAVQPAL